MSFWTNKKVLVTGGAGFIGSHLVEMLVAAGAKVRVLDNLCRGERKNLEAVSNDVELIVEDINNLDSCLDACDGMDVVMNLAAKVGGVGYNIKHSGTMFRDNVRMNTNMMDAAQQKNVERFLVVSSACVYTRFCTIPTPEEEGFNDHPEPTNFGYGWAKRIAEVQAMSYMDEFEMKIGIARPYNCYGPRDDFELETAHVVPALIKKVMDGQNPLQVWGDGLQTRSFVYVTDLARGMMLSIENYPEPDPLNIGTDEEISIKDLTRLVVEKSGMSPEIFFDTSKPAGQPRRNCDTRKAAEKAGYRAEVSLAKGIEKCIQWYKENMM